MLPCAVIRPQVEASGSATIACTHGNEGRGACVGMERRARGARIVLMLDAPCHDLWGVVPIDGGH